MLVFLSFPVSMVATSSDSSRTARVDCGSVVSSRSGSPGAGFASTAASCGTRRLPLAGLSVVFGALAVVALFRAVVVRDERRRNLAVRPSPALSTIDFRPRAELAAENREAPDDEDRSVVLAAAKHRT